MSENFFRHEIMVNTEMTMFLVNVLLIAIVIGVIIRINFMMKQQGTLIKVLMTDREAFSPAQRFANNARYRDAPNALLPEWKQVPKSEGPPPQAFTISQRGNFDPGYMVAPNQSVDPGVAQKLRSGASTIPTVGFDNTKEVVDTSTIPPETQSGSITAIEGYGSPGAVSMNPRANPRFARESQFIQPNESSLKKRREQMTSGRI